MAVHQGPAKTAKLVVRIEPSLRTAADEMAKAAGVSTGEFVRLLILERQAGRSVPTIVAPPSSPPRPQPADDLPTSPDGLAPGEAYRDSEGYVRRTPRKDSPEMKKLADKYGRVAAERMMKARE